MPLSRPACIPAVIFFVWNNNVGSILDVGVGFGGMGVLFRQTMDVRWGRVQENTWECTLDGIEIDPLYVTPIWQIYNDIVIGDMRDLLPHITKQYDLIFFGDVLEHVSIEEAQALMAEAQKKAHTVIVTTPQNFAGNEAEAERFHNDHEAHQCLLEDAYFPEGSQIETYGTQKIAIIPGLL